MIAVTSVEQSKRLIEAGVNPMTADMTYIKSIPSMQPYNVVVEDQRAGLYPAKWEISPAWSFSAIWDLMRTTNAVFEYSTSDNSKYVLDSLVESLINFYSQGRV